MKQLLFAAGIFLACCVSYMTGLRYVGSGDTRPSELLPISLLTEGNFNLSEFREDASLKYYYLENAGALYSAYSPVPALLNTVTFAAASLVNVNLYRHRKQLSLITSAAISAAAASLLFLVLRQLGISGSWALIGTALFAFGTTMWSVSSRGLWQHGPAVMFLHAGLYTLLRRAYPAAGLALGLCVASRSQCLLLAAPLLILESVRLWRTDRMKAAGLVCGFLLPLALLEYYFCAVLGRPLYFLQGGVHGLSGFGGNILVGLTGLIFNPSRGLFVFSPFLALGLYSALKNIRHQPGQLNALLIGAAGLLFLTASWQIWWGGHSFGYRIISEVSSPLIMALIFDLNQKTSRTLTALTAAAFAWSLWVHYLGAYIYPCGWNDRPEPIGAGSKRLWSVQHSEITACMRKLSR